MGLESFGRSVGRRIRTDGRTDGEGALEVEVRDGDLGSGDGTGRLALPGAGVQPSASATGGKAA